MARAHASIRQEFGITRPTVSQHLRVLRDSGYATVRPASARGLYAVRHGALREVDAWLEGIRRFGTPPLNGARDRAGSGTAPATHGHHFTTTTAGGRGVIHVGHQIIRVRRTVGERVLEAGTARVVSASQVSDASVEDLWDTCTSADRIPRWFMPISGGLRVGGRYQLEGNASGTVERCDPPRPFAATWKYELSWIEVRLEPEGSERTRLVLEHVAPVDDERCLQDGPGAVGIGWDLSLMGLRSTWPAGRRTTRRPPRHG